MNKIKTNLIRVGIYIRVSTDRQAKEGDSLDAQLKALKEYSKKNNYEVIDTYIDGGESGQKIKRTNLQRMLKDVEEHKIDLIIMTKLDRWFRNIADFYKVIDVLKKNNVNWKTIWEDYDTTTASGEFWLNMSLALGQMEAKRTGERIQEVFEYKFKVQKQVCSGVHIFGYDISKEKKLVINHEEAKQLNEIYDKYIETNSINKTTIWFSNTYKTASSRTIKKYLSNTAYIGKYKHYYTGTNEFEILENFAPSIIDKDKFNKVQEMIKTNLKNYCNKAGKNTVYIFSGLLFCKDCGNRLSGKKNSNWKRKYYSCKKHDIKQCDFKYNISEVNIENYLLEKINIVLESEYEKYKITLIKEQSIEQNLPKQIAKIKDKLSKLVNLYVEEIINIDYYKQEYSKLNNQLEQLEHKKSKVNQGKDFSKLLKILSNKSWKENYNSFDDLQKRKFWLSIIEKIIVIDKDNFNVILKVY